MWHAPLPPDPPTTHPPTSLLFRHSNGCVDGCVDVRVDVCACTRACLCVCGCRTHVPSHARTLTRAHTHTHTHASHAPRMHRTCTCTRSMHLTCILYAYTSYTSDTRAASSSRHAGLRGAVPRARTRPWRYTLAITSPPTCSRGGVSGAPIVDGVDPLGGCGAAARGWRAGRRRAHAPRLPRASGRGVPMSRVRSPARW